MKDAHLMDPDEMAQRFFSGEGEVHPVAVQYSRQEICDYFMDNINRLADVVSRMAPAQVTYRLPGAPSGPDSSGDEEHFDTSQIVTHLMAGIAFHWWGITRALKHERPQFPRPPEGVRTTAVKGRIMGAGGWSGESGETLAQRLRESAQSFINYVQTLPEDIDPSLKTSQGPFSNMTPHDWLFIEMMHAAMHLKQVQVMQTQPDYPTP